MALRTHPSWRGGEGLSRRLTQLEHVPHFLNAFRHIRERRLESVEDAEEKLASQSERMMPYLLDSAANACGRRLAQRSIDSLRLALLEECTIIRKRR